MASTTADITAPAANTADPMHRFWHDSLADADPEIAAAIDNELGRQRDRIELIASENIASSAVLEAAGSVFTNKYAEGYPGKRYYGGCEYADVVETLVAKGVLAGVPLSRLYPNRSDLDNYLLVAVTETNTDEDIAALADALKEALA